MFVIEDESHAEWCAEFPSFYAALSELQRRSHIPWHSEPNVCPCMSWRTCGREYNILEFDQGSEREISRVPVLSVSSKGVAWKNGFSPEETNAYLSANRPARTLEGIG
ncbi:MAG: hypothetical protein V4623_11125 [Pseudomonadota bacterium]